jgi:hypothetical protein
MTHSLLFVMSASLLQASLATTTVEAEAVGAAGDTGRVSTTAMRRVATRTQVAVVVAAASKTVAARAAAAVVAVTIGASVATRALPTASRPRELMRQTTVP